MRVCRQPHLNEVLEWLPDVWQWWHRTNMTGGAGALSTHQNGNSGVAGRPKTQRTVLSVT